MAFPIRRTVTKDPETGSKVKTLSYLGKNVKYVRETTKSKDGKDKTVKSALGVGKAGYGDFRAFKRKEKSSFEGKRISKAVQTTVRDKEGKVLGGKSVEKRGGVKTSLKDRVVTGKSTYKESYPNKDYNKKVVMKAAKEGAKEGAAKTSLATKRGIKNATKMNKAIDAYLSYPGKYDPEKVKKAMETGRGRKVQRVMRREFKNN